MFAVIASMLLSAAPATGKPSLAWIQVPDDPAILASARALGFEVRRRRAGFARLAGPPDSLEPLRLLLPSLAVPHLHEHHLLDVAGEVMGFGRGLDGRTAPGGGPLPDGTGVLIAIIDDGFDLRHPAFLDSQGRSRFLAVWNQRAPPEPGAPDGEGAVRWRGDLEAEPAFALPMDSRGHGTNVASAAAASAGPYDLPGVAPGATLLGVIKGDQPASFEMAVEWAFDVADSLGMPCVVNLSWARLAGPRDGTSVFDRFLDTLVGPGRLAVGAMGNSAADLPVLDGTLVLGDTLRTALALRTTAQADGRRTSVGGVDLWGESSNESLLRVELQLLDTLSLERIPLPALPTVSTNISIGRNDTVTWTDPVTGRTDTLRVTRISERRSPLNQHRRLYVSVEHVDASGGRRKPVVFLTGAGSFRGWSLATETGPAFRSHGQAGWSEGTRRGSLTEVGGTARRILSVGATVSRLDWVPTNGVLHELAPAGTRLGDLAPYSAEGPTRDTRTKPDVTAPGTGLSVAWSSHLQETPAIYAGTLEGGDRYRVVVGTSVAAPLVAGALARLLQVRPDLTPEEARALLDSTSDRDGLDSGRPDNRFGAGRIDLRALLTAVLGSMGEMPAATGLHPGRINEFRSGRDGMLRWETELPVGTTFELVGMDGRILSRVRLSAPGTQVRIATGALGIHVLRIIVPGLKHRIVRTVIL